jgi:hypothetical protein
MPAQRISLQPLRFKTGTGTLTAAEDCRKIRFRREPVPVLKPSLLIPAPATSGWSGIMTLSPGESKTQTGHLHSESMAEIAPL